MTSSNGKIFRVTGLWCGEFTGEVNSSHKGHWRGAHYDVTVMFSVFSPQRLTKYTYAMIMTRRGVVFFLTVQSLIHSLFSLTVAIYTSLIVDRVKPRLNIIMSAAISFMRSGYFRECSAGYIYGQCWVTGRRPTRQACCATECRALFIALTSYSLHGPQKHRYKTDNNTNSNFIRELPSHLYW